VLKVHFLAIAGLLHNNFVHFKQYDLAMLLPIAPAQASAHLIFAKKIRYLALAIRAASSRTHYSFTTFVHQCNRPA
jgi:hypothetical protein